MMGEATYPFRFGWLKIGYADGQIVLLAVTDHATTGQRTALTDQVAAQVKEYLAGRRQHFTFPYRLSGTPFQKEVWQALQRIPYGQTCSYQELAQAINRPRAVRAVGAAIGKNPILLAIPCHRVLGSKGQLTGYAGGLAMKKALLEIERKGTQK